MCVFVKWRMWSKYFRPLLRSAQTDEDDGHSLGQRHCRAGWCPEDLSSLCGRSGSSDGSVFVASWFGTFLFLFFIFYFFFSEIIGPAAAGPAGPAPAPLYTSRQPRHQENGRLLPDDSTVDQCRCHCNSMRSNREPLFPCSMGIPVPMKDKKIPNSLGCRVVFQRLFSQNWSSTLRHCWPCPSLSKARLPASTAFSSYSSFLYRIRRPQLEYRSPAWCGLTRTQLQLSSSPGKSSSESRQSCRSLSGRQSIAGSAKSWLVHTVLVSLGAQPCSPLEVSEWNRSSRIVECSSCSCCFSLIVCSALFSFLAVPSLLVLSS